MKKFIGEEIQVIFDRSPVYLKKPDCPNGIIWRNEKYRIIRLISAREDFSRRGRQENNMSPEHTSRASITGSWGVGRYFYEVEVEGGRIFEIYYDRAPGNINDRLGHWFLLSENVE